MSDVFYERRRESKRNRRIFLEEYEKGVELSRWGKSNQVAVKDLGFVLVLNVAYIADDSACDTSD
jgi:hypothetical protein